MMGAARSESSQVLCSTMVLLPPMKISEVYSSMALLLSPTYGTYCKTTVKLQYILPSFCTNSACVRSRPCHPPRCSWRSPWNGMSAVRIGSSRRCSPDGCS
ncbi:hypothetical protein CFC21_062726 [Triticum aestivum]|uniref:Uncharacterized protein n=2 Tax=Triticum aestivum TaxID=4565 RepID=A0A3B6JKW4_WHEAT|nr:hypothetical protein CFC21_062726 [Triticum aestivum]